MKKINRGIALIIVVAMMTVLLIGCSGGKETLLSTDEDFAFSYGIDKNGMWDGIKALKNVDLCDYMGISIPQEIHTVDDETVQGEIDSMLTNFEEKVEITDRAILNGDTVNIDYIGSIDDVEFEGGNTMGSGTEVTIGVTQYIDDFLEQLIGHSPGESFDIEVTFPDDYSSDKLAGQDAVFAITINYIIGISVPEVTDGFVTDNFAADYGWTTVQQMKDYIRDNIRQGALEYFVQDYIVANSTVNTLPQLLVEYQEFSMIKYYENYAQVYDMEYEAFLSAAAGVADTEELLTSNLGQNEGTASLYLLMQAIAEDADISISEEETIEYFNELAEAQSGDYTDYENIYGMNHLKLIALQRKVLDYVIENTVFE